MRVHAVGVKGRSAVGVRGSASLLAALCALSAACRDRQTPGAAADPAWNPAAWRAPRVDSLPDDSLGRAVRRGLALLLHTGDSLPTHVGANLACTSCHLDEGRRAGAASLAGVYARFPQYRSRSARVITIETRVNDCFERSLSGRAIPDTGREMRDIVAYLAFISRGVPVGADYPWRGLRPIATLTGDSARGATVYVQQCVRCHGTAGQGIPPAPALWGPRSFSIGASMARQDRAAAFVRWNMPFDRPGTLTDQRAYDVAAYFTSLPRPDMPGKENDWPRGDAPAHLPYATRGHEAFRPPVLLAR